MATSLTLLSQPHFPLDIDEWACFCVGVPKRPTSAGENGEISNAYREKYVVWRVVTLWVPIDEASAFGALFVCGEYIMMRFCSDLSLVEQENNHSSTSGRRFSALPSSSVHWYIKVSPVEANIWQSNSCKTSFRTFPHEVGSMAYHRTALKGMSAIGLCHSQKFWWLHQVFNRIMSWSWSVWQYQPKLDEKKGHPNTASRYHCPVRSLPIACNTHFNTFYHILFSFFRMKSRAKILTHSWLRVSLHRLPEIP